MASCWRHCLDGGECAAQDHPSTKKQKYDLLRAYEVLHGWLLAAVQKSSSFMAVPSSHWRTFAGVGSGRATHRTGRPLSPLAKALASMAFFPGACTSKRSRTLPSPHVTLRAIPTSFTSPSLGLLSPGAAAPVVLLSTTWVRMTFTRDGSASPSKCSNDQVPGQPAKPRTCEEYKHKARQEAFAQTRKVSTDIHSVHPGCAGNSQGPSVFATKLPYGGSRGPTRG